MCDFFKGSFIEYTTALSPYIISLAAFFAGKYTGILSTYQKRNEATIRNTWIKIEIEARNSVHKSDEEGVVHRPNDGDWKKLENDAVELAKKEHPIEWQQYEELEKK